MHQNVRVAYEVEGEGQRIAVAKIEVVDGVGKERVERVQIVCV
jgi:hypothetical protein